MQLPEVGRGNISEAAADAVRAMIVDGRLSAGDRLNEVHLARQLGVSRTPLREALSGLVAEGALIARPRLGYFVRPLTLEEFEQIYDLRPLLDPEALRLAGVPSEKRIARLEKLNVDLARAKGLRAIEIDDAWHMELLADCPNKVLIEMIRNIIVRTRRYELALMREQKYVGAATRDHERIVAALKAGDLNAACAALKENMQSGRAPIVAWLKSRAARKGIKS
ncbi:MAG: GntR family transcriptional regulator [Hyphomonadaceae bacterium]|nr:GntR family transcriptional regulator [Hyphomonadaceae bacterium]